MRTRTLATIIVLFGSSAALAQVSGTQTDPLTNNVIANETVDDAWENTTEPAPVPDDVTPTENSTEVPDELETAPPPTDPVPPQG